MFASCILPEGSGGAITKDQAMPRNDGLANQHSIEWVAMKPRKFVEGTGLPLQYNASDAIPVIFSPNERRTRAPACLHVAFKSIQSLVGAKV